MSERDPSQPKVAGTLLGVPAPRVENNVDSPARKPVFVRSGTSVVDADADAPPPVPQMALPNRPPLPEPEVERLVPPVAPSAVGKKVTGAAWFGALLKSPINAFGTELSLWMLLAPVLLVMLAITGALLSLPSLGGAKPAASGSAAPPASAIASAKPLVEKRPSLLAELEGRSPESL